MGLVFPNGCGKVEALSNIMQRGFDPIQVAAGVAVQNWPWMPPASP